MRLTSSLCLQYNACMSSQCTKVLLGPLIKASGGTLTMTTCKPA
uniref:Uncharacterized protein n=1 Tax=Arundo donax TaxID=35708 RepID=A0A0A9BZ97_ARUDO